MTAGGPILAIDTATSTAVVALGEPDGRLRSEASWPAGQRHSVDTGPWTRHPQTIRIGLRIGASCRPRSFGRP